MPHSGVPCRQDAISMTFRRKVGKNYNEDFENSLEEETQIFPGAGFTTDAPYTAKFFYEVDVISEESGGCCSLE